MTATDGVGRESFGALGDLPAFALAYAFDDDDDPSEVTVFPDAAEDVVTRWLTVDKEHAVPLEDVR